MTSCKAVLGVESGASVFDFDGSIQAAVEADLATDPTLDFATLRDRHFKDKEGVIRLNQISPRCFEAAALRTVMILYEGNYSGRLVPWRHYVPLRKDHSNMAEVVATLRDPNKMAAITEAAYQEVALNPVNHFSHFVREFDQALSVALPHHRQALNPPYDDDTFAAAITPDFATRRRLWQRRVLHATHRLVFGVLLANADEGTREFVRRHLRRGIGLARHLKGLLQRC